MKEENDGGKNAIKHSIFEYRKKEIQIKIFFICCNKN